MKIKTFWNYCLPQAACIMVCLKSANIESSEIPNSKPELLEPKHCTLTENLSNCYKIKKCRWNTSVWSLILMQQVAFSFIFLLLSGIRLKTKFFSLWRRLSSTKSLLQFLNELLWPKSLKVTYGELKIERFSFWFEHHWRPHKSESCP